MRGSSGARLEEREEENDRPKLSTPRLNPERWELRDEELGEGAEMREKLREELEDREDSDRDRRLWACATSAPISTKTANHQK